MFIQARVLEEAYRVITMGCPLGTDLELPAQKLTSHVPTSVVNSLPQVA
jgi:hypothetical protein